MNAGLKNAERWILIADRDLAAAVILVEVALEVAAFHLQKATEKYLGFLDPSRTGPPKIA